MAEPRRTRRNGRDDAHQATRRPLRPFLAGTGVAAAWGAFHMPAALWPLVLLGFAVELLAIAIALGGMIAVATDILLVLANRLPWILASVSRRS